MKTKSQNFKRLACSLCHLDNVPVAQCEGGYVCEDCSAKTRQGRDNTTKAVKVMQKSISGQAKRARIQFIGGEADAELEYDIAASEMMAAESLQQVSVATIIAGGEVLPQHDQLFVDTLAAPGTVALEASADRLALITNMGTDCAAMALDAAESIQASNSLEKMLAHQMAVCHGAAMSYVTKAALVQDPVHAVKMMNLGLRSMETFQKGLLTLKRLRGTGEQRITIQHVNVSDGGQAVIGQLQPGGGGTK